MSYLVVRQTDKKYAIFSTIADAFVYTECTRGDVLGALMSEYGCSSSVASEKIERADNDVIPFTLNRGNGQERWRVLSQQNDRTLKQEGVES